MERRPLRWFQRLAYGLGHVQNDLFGAAWFSYLLLYLQYVMKIPETTAGLIFMLGQFSDALITPLVAHKTDKLEWHRYGKRKTMHIVGTVTTSLTFPFVFTRCFGCETAPLWALLMYLIPLVCLFQLGWATVQVSHLSLIPELTSDAQERDELNIIRYAFNIFTDAMVYVIMYAVLASNVSVGDNAEGPIGPWDAGVFRDMAFILLGIGLVFTTIFHFYTPEEKKPRVVDNSESATTTDIPGGLVWKDWFRYPDFYKVSIIFAVSRVITNLLQVFVPLYLQEGTEAPQSLLATLPLVVNLSGFGTSLFVKPITKYITKKTLFLIAGGVAIVSCIWFAADSNDNVRAGSLYIIALLGGAGGSTMLVLGLSFAADLIGENTSSGGFVYACMAVADKIANGLTILMFQIGKGALCTDCGFYYRYVLCYGVAVFVLVNIVTMILLPSSIVSPKKQSLREVWKQDEPDWKYNLLDKDTIGTSSSSSVSCKYGTIRTGFPGLTKSKLTYT